jgi:hypothetical protein
MGREELSGPYLEAIRRGFNFARELGRVCGPVHLLVGISEGAGPAAAALSADRPLAEIVAAAGHALTDGATYLHMQAQGGARLFAASLGQRVGACSIRAQPRFCRHWGRRALIPPPCAGQPLRQ